MCGVLKKLTIVGNQHNFIAFHNSSNTKNFSGMTAHRKSAGGSSSPGEERNWPV